MLRRILLAAGVLGLAVSAALLAFWLLVPEQALRTMAIERLEATLGRRVRLESVRFGLLGVRLEGLEIAEAPDFDAGTFLRAGELRVRLRLWPLLHRRLEVSALTLSDWSCRISRDARGKVSVTSLGQGPAAEGEPVAHDDYPLAIAPPVVISRFHLLRGRFEYTDAAAETTVTLTEIDATGRGARLNGAFSARLEFAYAVTAASSVTGRATYQGELDLGGLDPDKMSARMEPLALEYRGVPVRLTGELHFGEVRALSGTFAVPALSPDQLAEVGIHVPPGLRVTPAEGELHLEASPKRLDLKTVKLTAGVLQIDASGVIAHWTSRPRADLQVAVRGTLPALSGAELRSLYPRAAESWQLPSLALTAAAHVRGDQVEIRSARVESGGFAVTARGTVDRAPKGPTTLDLDVHTDRLPVGLLAALSADLAALEPKGATGLDLHVSGPVAAPALSGSAHLRELALVYRGQEVRDMEGLIEFSPDTLSADVTGRWKTGDVSLELVAHDYRSAPRVHVDADLSVLDLAALSAALAPDTHAPGGTPGAATANGAPDRPRVQSAGRVVIGRIVHPNFEAAGGELEWNLTGLDRDLSRLSGSGHSRLGAGTFADLDPVVGSSSLLRVLLFPILIIQKATLAARIPFLPRFDSVEFKEMAGDYTFTNGVMTVRKSHLDSNLGYFTVTGTADLVDGGLDLYLATKLGTQVGLRLAGPLGFDIGGTLSAPHVMPNPTAILQQPGVNEAVGAGKKLLRKLLPR